MDKFTIASNPESLYSLIFCDETGKEVGWLSFRNGVCDFGGNITESAKLLFEWLKNNIDAYIAEELK